MKQKCDPEISNTEYYRLFRKLPRPSFGNYIYGKSGEEKFVEMVTPDSPTRRVGTTLLAILGIFKSYTFEEKT